MTKESDHQARHYRSDALRSAHTIALDLHAIGVIDDAAMREFDRRCLVDPAAGTRRLLDAIADDRDCADFEFDLPKMGDFSRAADLSG
jgi:hypothetical protein